MPTSFHYCLIESFQQFLLQEYVPNQNVFSLHSSHMSTSKNCEAKSFLSRDMLPFCMGVEIMSCILCKNIHLSMKC